VSEKVKSINIHLPDSLTKLPSYSTPFFNPICPPSPLTRSSDDLLNLFITPAGCELILCNPNKKTDGSTIKLIKAALMNISTNKADIKDLPFIVVGTGSPINNFSLLLCTTSSFNGHTRHVTETQHTLAMATPSARNSSRLGRWKHISSFAVLL
jgi:hypothetical protein